jgi:hypothetical protein
MSIWFCPRCGQAGTKSDSHTYCTKCKNKRQNESRRNKDRVIVPRSKTRAEEYAMKGFNQISQDYLQRKWI